MASLSGIFQRPIVAAAAVAAASFSTDIRDKFSFFNSSESSSTVEKSNSSIPNSLKETKSSWLSNISVSKLANLSDVTNICVPTPNIAFPTPSTGSNIAKPVKYTQYVPPSKSSAEVLHRWHLPDPKAVGSSEGSDCSLVKSKTVVVLLGWLGSKQKHLNRYAEWYTSRGYHVITFTFPMADLISYQVAGKAEQHVESLVNQLTNCLEEEYGKNLVFHTFSNTGWLTMVWCSSCAKNCERPESYEDVVLCGKVIDQNSFTEEPTFVKNAAGQSQLAGNYVRTIQSDYSFSRERILRNAYEDMNMAYGLEMDDGESIIRPAVGFYTIALDRNFTRGRRRELVQASCLYIACRENKKPFLLIDFSEYLRVNVYRVFEVSLADDLQNYIGYLYF